MSTYDRLTAPRGWINRQEAAKIATARELAARLAEIRRHLAARELAALLAEARAAHTQRS